MVVIILLFCLLIRYTVSLSPYSGRDVENDSFILKIK